MLTNWSITRGINYEKSARKKRITKSWWTKHGKLRRLLLRPSMAVSFTTDEIGGGKLINYTRLNVNSNSKTIPGPDNSLLLIISSKSGWRLGALWRKVEIGLAEQAIFDLTDPPNRNLLGDAVNPIFRWLEFFFSELLWCLRWKRLKKKVK